MEVTVYSSFDGYASGYITFYVPSNYTVQDLIKLYCAEKGVEVADDYALSGKENSIFDPQKSLEEEGIKNGDYIKLSKDDENLLFDFGSWWAIALIAFIIGCTGIAYCFYYYFLPQMGLQKYVLVIDAGSTHSQLFVFSWSKVENQGTGDVELIHDCIMFGGVADFRSHLQDLHDYFRPCIAEAEEMVPLSTRPATPLIFAATGGMRILRAYDPEGANLVLSTIREFFLTKTTFQTQHKDVFVVSGQQEGISGWAALNYLMENFQEEYQKDTHASALDLGGASVQVTTELAKDAKLWPTVNITIFNTTYKVYSKSFLCYGIGEAMNRYQYHLVRNTKDSSSNVIHNPCLPKGFETSFSSEDFLKPCVFSNKTEDLPGIMSSTSNHFKRFSMKYILKNSVSALDKGDSPVNEFNASSERIYVLRGTSDTHLCRKKVESLFDYELCRESFVLGDCLNKKLVPPYKGELVGFSSIFYQLLPLLGVSREGSLDEYETAVLETCSKSARELILLHPNVSQYMLEDLCFDGMYVFTLLKEGLGITSSRWKHILFTDKVKEQNVVWAMGLMLNRTTSVNPGDTQSTMDINEFSLLLGVFSSILMTSFLFFWYSIQIRRRGNTYQRVSTRELDPYTEVIE